VVPFEREGLVPCATFLYAQDWLALLNTIEIDPVANRMDLIPAVEGSPADSLPGLPSVRVQETEVSHEEVAVRFQVDRACFVRVALSHHPGLRVWLDGRETEFGETKDHYIYLKCPAGPHELKVRAGLSPLRRAMRWVSLLGLVGIVAALVMPRRRRARKMNTDGGEA
jgi:hypothetical protein